MDDLEFPIFMVVFMIVFVGVLGISAIGDTERTNTSSAWEATEEATTDSPISESVEYVSGKIVAKEQYTDGCILGVEWLGSDDNTYYCELHVDEEYFDGYSMGDEYPKDSEENRVTTRNSERLIK